MLLSSFELFRFLAGGHSKQHPTHTAHGRVSDNWHFLFRPPALGLGGRYLFSKALIYKHGKRNFAERGKGRSAARQLIGSASLCRDGSGSIFLRAGGSRHGWRRNRRVSAGVILF
jgi:hypothetical protein